jgi:hypothetical protein
MDLLGDLEDGRVPESMDGNQSQQAGERKIEPMELDTGEDEDDTDDSFLRAGGPTNGASSGSSQHALQGPPRQYLNGLIKAKPIGNMQIFFPEYFETSGWGVLGPQWFGPACVWGLLMLASHFCINKASALGIGSVIICYLFFGACTYFLTDVSLRDPGICLHKEVPETVPPSEMSQWRWCDFCHVYQEPGGAHCPDCNVCIAGYDHHCVWMGTCIGKRNYRQFVRFNVSWLYFAGYLLFWLITFGPLLVDK